MISRDLLKQRHLKKNRKDLLLSGRLQELANKEKFQLVDPKSTSGRGRSRELLITKMVVTRAVPLQKW